MMPHAETFVDGFVAREEARAGTNAVVRMGTTVVMLSDDVRRFEGAKVAAGAVVAGPTLRAQLDALETAARDGKRVLISGEPGTGKTLAARVFHEAAARNRPFVEVKSGALGREHIAAARGGTLFIDDVDLAPAAGLALLDGAKVRLVATTRHVANAPKVFDVEVRLPSLHERREDIAFLLGKAATAERVEAAMLKRWPGNVAELLGAPAHPARRRRG
ncbi:MAG: sigma 54-interacting transcriptional regulator [Myxococcaceae bacterium]|nr:sigma 54-interacting transcriptional regulator [Myxococcaceae bacterium]